MTKDSKMGGASDPLELKNTEATAAAMADHVHVIRPGVRCVTDGMGRKTPGGLSLAELILNAPGGSIPLWAPGVTLRWKFADGTLLQFKDPAAAEVAIEKLLGDAILAWGDAAPVLFAKATGACDFEVKVLTQDDCDANGCVLASAFFPDSGQHTLFIYPRMFQDPRADQIETLCHEIGHVFGLRHFFALMSEQGFPAELFGGQAKFTIMNYGDFTELTPLDRADLKRLYQTAWSGELTAINGTPIKFVKPFHNLPGVDPALAIAAVQT